MELPSAGFQRDDGAEGGLVAQDLPHYIHTDRLGLGKRRPYFLCPIKFSLFSLQFTTVQIDD